MWKFSITVLCVQSSHNLKDHKVNGSTNGIPITEEKENAKLESDLSKNKEKLTRALEYRADREELKDQIRRSKQAIESQKEEVEQARKDLDEERHTLRMAQWVGHKSAWSHSWSR